jgi:hypothetical protein
MYEPDDIPRKVDKGGKISFHNHSFRVERAFRFNPVALRPTLDEGKYDVFYFQQKVTHISLQEEICYRTGVLAMCPNTCHQCLKSKQFPRDGENG